HRYVVCRTLEQAGFHILAAADGKSALETARKLPDLILIDVKLPDLDGFEVCRKLKADPETSRIPIILYSGTSQNGSAVNDARQLGAASFLFFPIAPEHLLAVVRGCLSNGKAKKG
ncbi:MAG TPA: response regulator, partial [Terriglobales bacterium]